VSAYKYMQALWKKPKQNLGAIYSERLFQWRSEPSTVRVEHPTRLDRARALGFKAKQGYFVVRQRVSRGGRMRPKIRAGRRSAHYRRNKVLSMSYQWVAEQRAAREHTNTEVLNSYFVGKDKDYYYYEVILVDKAHPVVKADMPWIAKNKNKGRVFRGLTSAARKSRGGLV